MGSGGQSTAGVRFLYPRHMAEICRKYNISSLVHLTLLTSWYIVWYIWYNLFKGFLEYDFR
jgi:hypothetical protein